MSSESTDPMAEGVSFADLFAPSADEPAAEEPVAASVADEPAAEEPVVEEPVAAPVANEPAVEEPVVEEPVAAPVAEEPAVEEPVVEEPVAAPVAEEPAVEEPVVEEPVVAPVIKEPAPVEPLPVDSSQSKPVSESSNEKTVDFDAIMEQMDNTLARLRESMKRMTSGGVDDKAQSVVANDRALPAASPESERVAREEEAREAAEVAVTEVAAREAAENEASAAAEAKTAAEAAAREVAEIAAAEAAAREVAEIAAAEAAAREVAEVASDDFEREDVAEDLVITDDFLRVDDPFEPIEEVVGESANDNPFGELEPFPIAEASSPSDFPFTDDVIKPPSPQVTPAEGINEHEPFYAGLEEDDAALLPQELPRPSPPQEEMEAVDFGDGSDYEPPVVAAPPLEAESPPPTTPVDMLWAIANVDPEAQALQESREVLSAARTQGAEKPTSRRRAKVKLDALPFDALVPGTPLIATVFSPSGGVGKSSTAMSLGAYIATTAEAMAKLRIQRGEPNVRVPRVLLLDGDIVTGSLAMRLTGKVEPSIHTLMLYLDDRELEGFAGHDRWPNVYDDAPPGEKAMRDFVMWPEILPNLNLLAAPDEPDLFFDFGPKEYREVLQLLSRFYDVIIIDSGTEIIMESNRAWLAHANEVFLVTAPEVDRLHNAYKAARYIATARPHPQATDEQLEKLPPLVTADKLSLVMTKYDIDSGLDDIDDVINKIFPWLIDRPQQRFYVPDFSREMVRINNSNGQRFLVHENQVFAKVIGKMAKHMFSRYQLQRQRTLPPQG